MIRGSAASRPMPAHVPRHGIDIRRSDSLIRFRQLGDKYPFKRARKPSYVFSLDPIPGPFDVFTELG